MYGTVKDHMRLDYNPLPKMNVQNKIDYFFLPYNYEQDCSKNMPFKFNWGEESQRGMDWEMFTNFVFSHKE